MYVCYTDANTLGANLGCFIISTIIAYRKGEIEEDIISEFKINRFENINVAEEEAVKLGQSLIEKIGAKECRFLCDNKGVVERFSDKINIKHIGRRENKADFMVRNNVCHDKIQMFLSLEKRIADVNVELNSELLRKRNKFINMYNIAIKENEEYSEIYEEVLDKVKQLDKKIEKNKDKTQKIIQSTIKVVVNMANIELYSTRYLPSNIEESEILNKINAIGIKKIDNICNSMMVQA